MVLLPTEEGWLRKERLGEAPGLDRDILGLVGTHLALTGLGGAYLTPTGLGGAYLTPTGLSGAYFTGL